MENQFSFDLHNNPFKPGAEVNHPFLSSSFCRVLTALYYHLEYGSRILVLSAESGLGKTTLLRHLERRVRDRCRTLVLSPSHSKASELLRKLMAAVGGGAASRDFLPIQEQLDEILTRSARTESPFVLFLDFDEAAQDPALEILSRLACLQATDKGLLRIIVAACPDLAEQLNDSEVADEIVPLSPLLATEVESYIDHRLQQAGWRGGPLFSAKACAFIAETSCGKPSSINEICSELLQNPIQWFGERSTNANQKLENILDESDVEPLRTGWKSADATFPDSSSHKLRSRRPQISKAASLDIDGRSRRPLNSRRTAAPVYVVLVLVITCIGLWYQTSIKAGSASAAIATWHDRIFHNEPSIRLSTAVHLTGMPPVNFSPPTAALNPGGPSTERLLKKDRKLTNRPFSTISGSALVLPQRLILHPPPEYPER